MSLTTMCPLPFCPECGKVTESGFCGSCGNYFGQDNLNKTISGSMDKPQAPPVNASVFLDKMSGFDFEELVADILSRLGYGSIEKVLFTQDEGRDILVRSPTGLVVVECKHHPKGTIGRPVVQKLHSAVISSGAVKGLLVTTGKFTQEAVDYANKLAASGTVIEMIDRPILTDMSTRAGIRLVIGNESLSVWTYPVPALPASEKAVTDYMGSFATSYPRPLSLLVNGTRRNVSYRPVYLITYNVNAVFETTVGVIHRESARNASVVLDGTYGQMYSDQVITFLRSERQVIFSKPSEDFQGTLPTFRVDSNTLNRNARKTIMKLHTKRVSYYGKNNVSYTRLCEPGEREIYISDIRQVYVPLLALDFRLINAQYHIEGAQGLSGSFLPLGHNFRTCRICNEQVSINEIICDACGNVTHSGGFRLKSVHGFRCNRCQRTTCRMDGHWRRRYLVWRELVCRPCYETARISNGSFRNLSETNRN
jgi:restriction system protein